MASVKMPESVPCKFDEGGLAPCQKPSDNGWCSDHEHLKCVSCSKKAVRSCDHGMGGLCCGIPLCKTCQHGEEGIHITSKVYAAQAEERAIFEKTGQESPRMLAKRGIPAGLPRNLKEILDGDRKGWTNKPCWGLELSHGLMGFFPAIVEDTKIMVIVSDKPSIFRVWRSLEPCRSKLIECEFMVNDAGTVAYPMNLGSDYDKKQSLPQKLFSTAEIKELFARGAIPFKWAPGLFGASIHPGLFKAMIEDAEMSKVV